MTVVRDFTCAQLEREARRLHRCMSLARAGRMLGVSPGQVARWRDGAPLTDVMQRRVALSIVAREYGMVSVFGRVDTGGLKLAAKGSHGGVVVRVTQTNDERGGA